MIPERLIAAASFNPTSLRSPNAWIGHLPFAAWVMQQVSPKIFVELGTHSGNSYFAFCQSVAEAHLSTQCYAIDTWQGDEHAGQYGEEIFASVYAHNQANYSAFSRLLRMTFDEAASYFSDESIGLLHIDGLHTYDAVRHDFATWLPKLAPGAVVMFHDTNVRERNFGVWKLWEELQAHYPNNLEFAHSHGLGVLQLDNASEDKKLAWLQPEYPGKETLKSYFAALGARQLERFDFNELKQYADSLNQAVTEREGQIASLNQGMHERDAQLAALHQALAERDGELAMLKNAVTEYVARIKRFERLAQEHVQKIHTTHDQLQKVEQDRHLLENAMKEKEAQISALTEDLSKIKEEVHIFRAEKRLIYESIQNTKNIFLAPTN